MRYSCKEGDDSAEGFAVGEESEGNVGWIGLGAKTERDGSAVYAWVVWSFILLGVRTIVFWRCVAGASWGWLT